MAFEPSRVEFSARARLQVAVFEVLSSGEWCCRSCSYAEVPSGQLAGGGGIQGLQRGSRSRPGLILERKRDQCGTCNSKTIWDRWTGETREAVCAAPLSPAVINRVLALYGHRDALENTQRTAGELVIDHRFPMIRWGQSEEALPDDVSDEVLRNKFQLLKKDAAGNHNQLKSRACETCAESGKRGTPLGIDWFYRGSQDWPDDIPTSGPEAENGCVGCGWYDFHSWQSGLNALIADNREMAVVRV